MAAAAAVQEVAKAVRAEAETGAAVVGAALEAATVVAVQEAGSWAVADRVAAATVAHVAALQAAAAWLVAEVRSPLLARGEAGAVARLGVAGMVVAAGVVGALEEGRLAVDSLAAAA